MNNPSDIQAVGNEVATVLLQRLAQSHIDDPEGRNLSVRVARVEAHVESILMTLRDLREDFRDFKKYVDERFERVDDRFNRIDERFDRIDARFKHVDERFERVDDRFNRIDDRFERVMDQQQRDFRLTWGAMIAGFLGLAGMMAKGFHWF